MTARLQTIRSYSSRLNGENVSLIMYRHGRKYGIVLDMGEVLIAKDYRGTGELRSFPGNEVNIIDWTTSEIANDRYLHELTRILARDKKPEKIEGGNFGLRLVHG